MPVPVSNISTDNHRVVVGLSDAYYYDEYFSEGNEELSALIQCILINCLVCTLFRYTTFISTDKMSITSTKMASKESCSYDYN